VPASDDLYGLPFERFVAERGALAKQLRGEGRRDEAAAVAALRKPSVAAWAVNQLVRTQGAAVQDLFTAGDALRDAQARVLAGDADARALRESAERERAAVDRLVAASRGLLSAEGHELSGAVIDRVGETLHAAALDEAARARVREGRLERELRHVGLGLGEAAAIAPAPRAAKPRPKAAAPAPRTAKPKAKAAAPAPRTTKPTRDRAAEQRAERERAAARKAARSAEASARRAAERAGRALRLAEAERERAARVLNEADAALDAARAEAAAAEEAHRRAKKDVDSSA
jgi:hypothetical protein